MTQLTPPHNSEWIIAYGQGHQLQHEIPGNSTINEWADSFIGHSFNPISNPHVNWRIKPEPVVIERFYAMDNDGCYLLATLIHNTLDDLKASLKKYNFLTLVIAYQKITVTDGIPKVEMVN